MPGRHLSHADDARLPLLVQLLLEPRFWPNFSRWPAHSKAERGSRDWRTERGRRRFPFLQVMCLDDDAFFLRSDEEIEDFAAKYKERVKVPMWVTGATPLSVTGSKLEPLAAAGLIAIRMGIQSGSSRTKKLYRRSHSNRSVLQAVRLIDGYRDRIKLRQYDIILDNPWETEADLRETLLLLSRFPVRSRRSFFR